MFYDLVAVDPIRGFVVPAFLLGMQKLLFWRNGSGTSTGIEEVKKGAEMEAASRMSTFYISHGSPMLPLEEGSTRDFLAEKLPSLVGPRCCGMQFLFRFWPFSSPNFRMYISLADLMCR